MEKLTSTILWRIKILRDNPKMIISNVPIDFHVLRVYIEGYLDSVNDSLDINLMKNISNWFQAKLNQEASVYWTTHILLLHKDKSDGDLRSILLNTLINYFEENPNWYFNTNKL